MNIILGEENIANIDTRYTVLELDTFELDNGSKVKSYCLVESIPLNEMADLDQYKDLHNGLIRNYQKSNWNYCEQAIEHLRGRWGGELDSFYDIMLQRIP